MLTLIFKHDNPCLNSALIFSVVVTHNILGGWDFIDFEGFDWIKTEKQEGTSVDTRVMNAKGKRGPPPRVFDVSSTSLTSTQFESLLLYS